MACGQAAVPEMGSSFGHSHQGRLILSAPLNDGRFSPPPPYGLPDLPDLPDLPLLMPAPPGTTPQKNAVLPRSDLLK